MKIKNKIESYNLIKELKLNCLPEKVFKKGEDAKVLLFLDNFPAEYYAIRDKSKAGGIFKLKVKAEDVLHEIEGNSIFSVNVSSYNYVENQLLIGEILINEEMVCGILSCNKEYSVRDAIKNPDFNFVTTIFDDKLLDKIPHFDEVYNYIIDNNLQGIIVEFALFDKDVGVNCENIVIYELRTDY